LEKTDNVLQLMHEYGLHPDTVDMDGLCSRFLDDMKAGLNGETSSLAMLPTYISADFTVPCGRKVIVLDAGGTNFRSCTASFEREDPGQSAELMIRQFSKHPMPGTRRELSADSFFTQMADYAQHVLPQSDTIGFCFSYPAKITPDRDGILLHFSKEIKAPEVVGRRVGKGFAEKAQKLFPDRTWQICVLNDTAATLLAAAAVSPEKNYSSYIGFILGTGTNTSYVEQNENIAAADLHHVSGNSQIVNVESGNFAADLSPLDHEFYLTTKSPETYHLEKIISGAYLGPYVLFVLKKLAADTVSPETAERIQQISSLDTVAMDAFLHDPAADSPLSRTCTGRRADSDKESIYSICDTLIERAAKLTAVNLSAAVLKSDAGKQSDKPVCINADGTTFHKTHNLKAYTREFIEKFLTQQHGRYTEFLHIDNAPIIGAAAAGLQAVASAHTYHR